MSFAHVVGIPLRQMLAASTALPQPSTEEATGVHVLTAHRLPEAEARALVAQVNWLNGMVVAKLVVTGCIYMNACGEGQRARA